jgi:hypothetical protein
MRTMTVMAGSTAEDGARRKRRSSPPAGGSKRICMWGQRAFVAGTALFVLACLPLLARSLRAGWRGDLRAPESFGSLAALLGANALLLVAIAPGGASGAIALILMKAALALALAFTRAVFRPRSFLGTLLLVAGGLALAASLALDLAALGDAGVAPASPAFRIGQCVTAFPLGWLAVETFLERRRALRGARARIADPIVANRFGLWCATSAALAASCAVALAKSFTGPDALEPLLAVRGALATIAGLGVWLGFAPPRRYLAWIAARV